jgi:hypothetical protein
MTKLKTIRIETLYWFDRVYGNSYYSAQVTVNWGMNDEASFCVPFRYGNPDSVSIEIIGALCARYNIKNWSWAKLDDLGIKKYTGRPTKALQRDVKAFGKKYEDMTLHKTWRQRI